MRDGEKGSWRLIRTRDGMLLGRYVSKPKALAAALGLSSDGRQSEVVQDVAPAEAPEPLGVLLPMRGH